MKFENMEKFNEFLSENMKLEYDLDAYISDFVHQIGETGAEHYELRGTETKSGRPECISFERIDHYILDGEEVEPDGDFDEVETTIIF